MAFEIQALKSALPLENYPEYYLYPKINSYGRIPECWRLNGINQQYSSNGFLSKYNLRNMMTFHYNTLEEQFVK